MKFITEYSHNEDTITQIYQIDESWFYVWCLKISDTFKDCIIFREAVEITQIAPNSLSSSSWSNISISFAHRHSSNGTIHSAYK